MSLRSNLVHIVDDDRSFRESVARLLKTAGYEIVEHETAEHLLGSPPDDSDSGCLLLDVRMPGITGPELQQRLSALGITVPIVFLTGYSDVPATVRAIKLGAEDFLTKPVDAERLLDAIERAIARQSRSKHRHDRLMALHQSIGRLTPREKEVFGHVAKGHQSKQIAYDLGTTIRTIKAHRRRVMEKLETKSVIELVSIARTAGLLPSDALGEDFERH